MAHLRQSGAFETWCGAKNFWGHFEKRCKTVFTFIPTKISKLLKNSTLKNSQNMVENIKIVALLEKKIVALFLALFWQNRGTPQFQTVKHTEDQSVLTIGSEFLPHFARYWLLS